MLDTACPVKELHIWKDIKTLLMWNFSHCFLWPSGFIKGKELLDLTSCAEGLCCMADQFILFLQMAILNYKNFSKSFSSKFPMMKVNVILSLLCHAGLQGEWRRSSIEATAAPTVQSIPTFVWTYITILVFLVFCLHKGFLFIAYCRWCNHYMMYRSNDDDCMNLCYWVVAVARS